MNKKTIAIIIAAVLVIATVITVSLLCCNKSDKPAGPSGTTPVPEVTDTAAGDPTPAPADVTADPAQSAGPGETGELVETGDPAETDDTGAWIDQQGEDIVIEIPTDQGSGGL